MVRITHQHQIALRNVQKNMVSSQNQVKICHAKPPGYQLLMRLLQLVLQLAQVDWPPESPDNQYHLNK
ncbi:hypothetical protein CP48_08830 [Escherichia coli]|nr:hypothetical protein CP48_08830 [Escherichia coli]